MHMRVRLVGMKYESVPVLTPKFLPCEVSNRSQHFVRWRSGWHREHELLDELGRLSARRGGEGGLPSHVVQIEVPVVQEVFAYPTTQALAVVGL